MHCFITEKTVMLSDEKKQKYVAEGGVRCPFCGSDQIEAGMFNHDIPLIQEVSCLEPICGKRWFDEFKIVDVMEID